MNTDIKTIDNNRLINAFLGYPYNMTDRGYPKEVLFHSNWEYLMPVVQKIEEMGYEVSITKARCEIKDKVNLQDGYYGYESLNTKIEAVYAAVIEFIKHYNQTKP